MIESYEDGIYVAMPDNAVSGRLSWVLACHGSGRCALSYRDVPFYARQRDIAINAGFCFVACDMGPDTYGTPRGLYILDKSYEYIEKNYHVYHKAALWASSAGGCVMFRFAQTYPDRVALLMGIFPIWDMSSGIHLKSMQNAWGGLCGDELLQRITPYNPANHPELLPNIPIVIAQGLNDRAVSPRDNSLMLKATLGDCVMLHLTDDEHSAEAFGLYDTPLFSNAMIKLRSSQQSSDSLAGSD